MNPLFSDFSYYLIYLFAVRILAHDDFQSALCGVLIITIEGND